VKERALARIDSDGMAHLWHTDKPRSFGVWKVGAMQLVGIDLLLRQRLPGVLVIKGSPDGTGRYLFYSPELREALKPEVKGRWGSMTVERICEWIDQGRQNLSLALLYLGGKFNPLRDGQMLARCSHYLLVSRLSEPESGNEWDEICRSHRLATNLPSHRAHNDCEILFEN
jgi:hypothetical protein